MDGELIDGARLMKQSSRVGFAQGQMFKHRILVAQSFVLFCFAILIARFTYLQVFQHDALSLQAQMNRTAQVPIDPARGLI